MPSFKKPNMKIPTVTISALKRPNFKRPEISKWHESEVCPVRHTWIFISLLGLLIALSAVVIGLKGTTLNFIGDNMDRGFTFESMDMSSEVLGALPQDLFYGPSKTVIVSGLISIFIAIVNIGFIVRSVHITKKQLSYRFRRNAMFVHILNSILILLSMIAIFVTHKGSSHFDIYYTSRKGGFGSGGVYDQGTFDLETWSCELKNIPGAMVAWDDFSQQCSLERASRWMMIPYILVGSSLACLSVWEMVGVQRERTETQKTDIEEAFEMN